jgi:hypothetical protein
MAPKRGPSTASLRVALHFSLPGLMSLLSLVDPASTTLWRVSFAIVAAGVVAVALAAR